MVSLMYPVVSWSSWSIGLIVFLVTYVVPNFAELYSSMRRSFPAMTQILIAVGTTARKLHPAVRWRRWSRPSSASASGRDGESAPAQDRFGQAARSRSSAKSGSSIRWRSSRAC